MNCYVTLKDLYSAIGESVNTELAQIAIESASRAVDHAANRVFYTYNATRYVDVLKRNVPAPIPDVLLLTGVYVDVMRDRSYSLQLTSDEYELLPLDRYPKTHIDIDLPLACNSVKLVGVFGAGCLAALTDAFSSTSIAVTMTQDATSFSVEHGSPLSPLQTVRADDEQMFIVAIDEGAAVDTAHVQRGVNGTTAAAHTDALLHIARYPRVVQQATLTAAVASYRSMRSGDYESERIGDYAYTRARTELAMDAMRNILLSVTRFGYGGN